MSQLRHFLAGRKDVVANIAIDTLIWLNYEGHKFIRVGGKPDDSLIRREDVALVSLEKFMSKHLEFFFRPDLSRVKLEELYLRFTNRMDPADADIVYKATKGELELDLEFVKAYAGDRKVGGNGAYVFRDDYIAKVAEPAPAPKKEESKPEGDGTDPLAGITAPETETPAVEKSAEKPAAEVKSGRGRRGKKPADQTS